MNFLYGRANNTNGVPRHWHITRDIKPRGECAACDAYWKQYDEIEAKAGLKSVTPELSPDDPG